MSTQKNNKVFNDFVASNISALETELNKLSKGKFDGVLEEARHLISLGFSPYKAVVKDYPDFGYAHLIPRNNIHRVLHWMNQNINHDIGSLVGSSVHMVCVQEYKMPNGRFMHEYLIFYKPNK